MTILLQTATSLFTIDVKTFYYVLSASLPINIASVYAMVYTCRLSYLSVCRSVGRSVCLCVQKVYCGKTADWIRMPFGMVSGVGISVLDGVIIVEGKGAVLGR